jgi:hypothetical protein
MNYDCLFSQPLDEVGNRNATVEEAFSSDYWIHYWFG